MWKLLAFASTVFTASIDNRFHGGISEDGGTIFQGYGGRPIRIEVLASHGMDNKSLRKARDLIVQHYTGNTVTSGTESDEIGSGMEKDYPGFWMVAIFDSDYDMAYTITRRSKNYVLFGLDDGHNILMAKENPTASRWERLKGKVPDEDNDKSEEEDFASS